MKQFEDTGPVHGPLSTRSAYSNLTSSRILGLPSTWGIIFRTTPGMERVSCLLWIHLVILVSHGRPGNQAAAVFERSHQRVILDGEQRGTEFFRQAPDLTTIEDWIAATLLAYIDGRKLRRSPFKETGMAWLTS